MAMLASKSSYPPSMGMGSTQAPSSQYSSTVASHRTPVIGSSHNGPFASPTESEFSDGYDSSDAAVRYAISNFHLKSLVAYLADLAFTQVMG